MIAKNLRTFCIRLLAVVIAVGGILVVATPALVGAQSTYGSGTYGTCTYNACGITFGSDPTVNIDVTPAAGATTCSVGSGQVQVSTDSSTGYTLSMADTDTDTALENGGTGTIASAAGTSASPVALSANKWGYRVDSINGFGAGPTSAISNASIPAVNFAAIPSSAATPDTIATSTSAASPYVSTYVWFGLCADASQPNGAYSDSVTYTVVVN
jgi:hypothetical protein